MKTKGLTFEEAYILAKLGKKVAWYNGDKLAYTTWDEDYEKLCWVVPTCQDDYSVTLNRNTLEGWEIVEEKKEETRLRVGDTVKMTRPQLNDYYLNKEFVIQQVFDEGFRVNSDQTILFTEKDCELIKRNDNSEEKKENYVYGVDLANGVETKVTGHYEGDVLHLDKIEQNPVEEKKVCKICGKEFKNNIPHFACLYEADVFEGKKTLEIYDVEECTCSDTIKGIFAYCPIHSFHKLEEKKPTFEEKLRKIYFNPKMTYSELLDIIQEGNKEFIDWVTDDSNRLYSSRMIGEKALEIFGERLV